MAGCFLGVDGCRGGWFAVALAGPNDWTAQLFSDLAGLSNAFPDAELILIDIPLGLPSCGPRGCDREARRLLGRGYASSIFPVPCRPALEAPDYRLACAANRQVLGVGISRQSYLIGPKIREADRWRRSAAGSKAPVRESHPELAFRALNGGRTLGHKKKTALGKTERLVLLRRQFPKSEAVVEQARREHHRRNVLADDDVLDALCLAVTAHYFGERLESVPAAPEVDDYGLPMEIVYGPSRPA